LRSTGAEILPTKYQILKSIIEQIAEAGEIEGDRSKYADETLDLVLRDCGYLVPKNGELQIDYQRAKTFIEKGKKLLNNSGVLPWRDLALR